jgi:hypothetical protein
MGGKSTTLAEKIERLFAQAGRPMSFEEIRFQIPTRSDEIRAELYAMIAGRKLAKSSREERIWERGSLVVTRTYYAWIGGKRR